MYALLQNMMRACALLRPVILDITQAERERARKKKMEETESDVFELREAVVL